jgi:hypothetical protein
MDIDAPTEEQRKAIKSLSALYPILAVMTKQVELENPGGQIRLAVISKSPDGTGKVGPSWEVEQFLNDLKTLAGL